MGDVNGRLRDVVVVGGGIAGLAAAYELQRRGLSVQVLEAADRPGGVIVTERFDGWVIDGGPDSLLVQKPAAVSLCREFGHCRAAGVHPHAANGLHPAGRHAAPPHRRIVSRIPLTPHRARPLDPVLGRRQAAHGRRDRVPRHDGSRGRIDCGVRTPALRGRGCRLSRGAAPGGHPCRRRGRAVGARALPSPHRRRTHVGQCAAQLAGVAREAVAAGRVRLAARAASANWWRRWPRR